MSFSDSTCMLFELMERNLNFSDSLQHNDIGKTDEIFANYVSSLYTVGETATIVLICIYVPVFLVAFVGNAMLLVIVLPHRAVWGVTSSFLVNLALADILVAVVCIPMTVAEKVYPLWVYGDVMCKAVTFLQGVSVTASTFTLAVMSMDRCIAIRHPMKCRSIRTSGHVRTLLIFIWIFSAIVISPLLFLRKTVSHEILPSKFITYCVETWPSRQTRRIYDVVLLIVLYAIPGTVVIVSYSLMGRRLWTTDKTLEHSRRQNSVYVKNKPIDSIMAGRRNLARMLIVMAALFAACWLPYSIITTYAGFAASDDTASVLNVISFSLVLGHFNSAVNPILYSFMNRTFRRYMKKLLRCHGRRRQSRQNEKGYLLAKLSWKTRSVKSTFVSSLRGRSNSHSTNPSSERCSPKHGPIVSKSGRKSLGGYGTIMNGNAIRECPEGKFKSTWDKLKKGHKARTFSGNVFHNFDEGLNIPTTIGEELSENMKTSPSSHLELSQLSIAMRSDLNKSLSCDLHVDSTNCEIHENMFSQSTPMCKDVMSKRDNEPRTCENPLRCSILTCLEESQSGEGKELKCDKTSCDSSEQRHVYSPLDYINSSNSLESLSALYKKHDNFNKSDKRTNQTNCGSDKTKYIELNVGNSVRTDMYTNVVPFRGSKSAHVLANPLHVEFRENLKHNVHGNTLHLTNVKGTKVSISSNNLLVHYHDNVPSDGQQELQTTTFQSDLQQLEHNVFVNPPIPDILDELEKNICFNPLPSQMSGQLQNNTVENRVHLHAPEQL